MMSGFAMPEIRTLRGCRASRRALGAEGEDYDTRHYDVTKNGGAVWIDERI
jgi:hypothetical protein